MKDEVRGNDATNVREASRGDKSRVLILGDSHTVALRKACETRVRDGTALRAVEFDIHWLMTEKGGTVRGDLKLEDALRRAATLRPSDAVVVCIAGTAHNIFGLLQHEQPFDVLALGEERSPAPAGASIIPANALRDMFTDVIRQNKRIRVIRDAAPCAAYHLCTPPPKGNNRWVSERIVQYRGRLASETGITAAPVRLKLWELEMSALGRCCRDWDMHLVLPPQAARSTEGFLRPEYYANDATHANGAYGELVLQQLEQLAAQSSLEAR